MKTVLTLLLALIGCGVYAQYIPNNSQVFQFSPVFNPAFSGVENFGDLKLGYRYQWSGFGENAPKFVNLSYNTRIIKPLDLTYNSLRISNPSLMQPQGVPKRKRIIGGLGINLFQSTIGVLESVGGGLNFTFNYPIAKRARLSFGVGGYVENRKFDLNKITLADSENDPFYNHLLNSSSAQTDLNVRAGFLLYSENFYIGGSYLPLMYEAIESSDIAFEEAFYQATAQAGIAIHVNSDFVLRPSALALLRIDNSIDVDATLKAYIQDKVWAGITYRTVESGIGMVGLNINQLMSVSYSYEMSLGKFQKFSDGSHELVLSFRLKNVKKFTQYTW